MQRGWRVVDGYTAASSWTVPATASVLTGLEVHHHGLYDVHDIGPVNLITAPVQAAAVAALPQRSMSSPGSAPEGTVALVFTDVEGSSRLWEQLDAAFKDCLDVHDHVLRDCLAAHGGYEVKTEGDAFMVAFHSAADALSFCAAAQSALQAATWPPALPDGLRVRMGVHVGPPICTRDPLTGRADYYGPVVNRAARVSAAAHGGQVLASEAAAEAAGPELDVRDLGAFELTGLNAPERLHQVMPRALAARTFPPPRARALRRTNVVPPSEPIVGRAEELGALAAACARPGLTAVHGLPGVGKTRLLTEVAVRVAQDGRDVWAVDLHGSSDEAEALARIAATIGVPLSDADALGHALGARGPTLLVLDGAAPGLRAAAARWVTVAPRLHVVVAARTRTTIPGAVHVDVGPLAIADARALFLAHARAVVPGFSAEQDELDALVRALDGLPLALVLAAPRVRTVSVDQLRRRLDARFSLLRRQDASGSASLAAALDEAWAPLTDAQRAAVVSLTVFEGAVPVAWAERVLEAIAPDAFALDLLEELADHGLLRRESGRLVLPSIVRAYARSHGEVPAPARGAHLDLCADRVPDAVCLALRSRGLGAVPTDVVDALDELRAAVMHADGGSPAVSRCATAAARILMLRGPLDAAVDVLERAAALPGTPDAAALLLEAAHLTMGAGRPAHAERLLRQVDPDAPTAVGLRGALALQRGQDAEAEPLLRAGLAEAVTRADRRFASYCSAYLGHICSHRGDLSGAARRFSEALAHARAVDDLRLQADWIGNAGYAHQNAQDHASARRAYEQALALARELHDRRAEGLWLGNLADVLRELRDLPAAADMTAAALQLAREVGDRKREGVWLGNLGDIRLALGDPSGEDLLRASVDVLDPAWPLGAGVFRRHLAEALHARGARAESRVVIERAAATLRGTHAVEFARLALVGVQVARADDDAQAAKAWLEEASEACRTLEGLAADSLRAQITAWGAD